MSKKFVAKPIDGDLDGVVQEGTEWERPIVPEFESEEAFEAAVAETPVEPLETVAGVIGSYELVEGDSWASVAAKHPLAGLTKHERATELLARYGEAVAGKVIGV